MSFNRLIPFLLCFLFGGTVMAQSTYEAGLLPAFNLNKKLKNDWSLNSRIESRQLFLSGGSNEDRISQYEYVLTDISMIAAKKVGLDSRIAGGYLMRIEDGEIIHRFSQQYTIVKRKFGFRLAHRFLTDQTISPVEKTEFRLRYRVTAEIPLNGKSVDPKEFYLRLNNEYVNSLQDFNYDLEIRLVPLLGYAINTKNKVEIGLDYRIDSFLANNPSQSFWTSLNWFIDL
ncbi:Protein of unknown function [Aquiflexum balticum DSM 16537]|uniref:DUF2490 domain-containing protein n=2 Tax=Aquiflexum TaxID=280472 RepID=A0A1W2GZQ5_9BACT|nr:Protein of unknown function [Aquiflexum balticum DSM 16537]